MNPKKIYLKRLKLTNKILKLNKKIHLLEKKEELLKELCPHKLILVFDDQEIHKVGKIYTCICPSCGEKEEVLMDFKNIEKNFPESNIIDLTKYPMKDFYGNYSTIVNYVLRNYKNYENISELENEILEDVKVRKLKK